MVRAYLENQRIHIPRTYREAMTYLCDTADKVIARAQASPDALLPPAPPRVSMYHVPSAEWRAARGAGERRGRGGRWGGFPWCFSVSFPFFFFFFFFPLPFHRIFTPSYSSLLSWVQLPHAMPFRLTIHNLLGIWDAETCPSRA